MCDSKENISIFNKNLLEAWNFQNQCVVEEFVRRMREERICPIYNKNMALRQIKRKGEANGISILDSG